MPLVVSPSQRPSHRSLTRRSISVRACTPVGPCAHSEADTDTPLAHYTAPDGRRRELLAVPGHAGSVLVLDRDATTLGDRRLLAHLGADEPRENAQLVCNLYLADPDGRWCRRLEPADLGLTPLKAAEKAAHRLGDDCHGPLVDRHGNTYQLRVLQGERSGLQLRWCRCAPAVDHAVWQQLGLRDVVANLESYEPVRTLTERALELPRSDANVSLARLEAELERLTSSPIVLNRGLREAVLEAIRTRGLSMSEVARRCGMVKCDRRGKLSGETSWLARRVGIMPEGGEQAATPWVHSDVLGLIARKGLGLSPREVEL